jgi:hypothetical protein
MTTIEILEDIEIHNRTTAKGFSARTGSDVETQSWTARADAVHDVTMQMPQQVEMSDLRARYQRTISAFREDLRAIDEIVKRVSFDIDGGD